MKQHDDGGKTDFLTALLKEIEALCDEIGNVENNDI
jgi:hypothetical protein